MQQFDESLFEDGLFTIEEAIEFSKIGKTKLYAIMNSGRLLWVKIDHSRRIPKRALKVFLAENAKGGQVA